MHLKNELLIKLAEKYGTPLYVYNGDLIIQRYKELFDFIIWPKLRIFYAMKANYNFAILKLLNKIGACIDAISPAEVLLAMKAGFNADRILYTANNMTDEEVAYVKNLGVLINVDSLSRLEKFGKKFQGSEVCLRFNPDVVAGAHKKIQTGGDLTKFGILLKDVGNVKEIVQKYNLKVIGLHEHTGSGISEIKKILQSMQNLLSIAAKENFPNLRFIDFGGGFQVPYKPTDKRIDYRSFGAVIVKIFSEFCKDYGKELGLYFEPGRYIVAESGYLIIEVNTLKNNNNRLIAGTNSGFPHLIRPVFYDAYHYITNLTNPNGKARKYDVCGNICETGDCFAVQREIPEIREGDLLAIQNAGAYCYSMGGFYNLRPMPAEVMVMEGKDKLVRKRPSNEEFIEKLVNEST